MGFLDELREIDRQVNGQDSKQEKNGCENTPGMNGCENTPGMNGYGNTPGINGYENYKKEMKPAGNFLEQIKAEIGESPEKVQKREQERKNEELIEAFMEEIRMVMLSKARSRDYYTPYNCQDKIIETDITNLSSFKKLFPDSRVDLKGFLRTPEFNLAYSYKRKPAEELFEKLKIRAGLDGIYLSLRPDCVKARITLPED